MTDKYQALREAAASLPRVKWTASRSNVTIPETEDMAGKTIGITGLNKLYARRLARYIADANPATIQALLAERDALRMALYELVGVLQVRHHGRMPDEVKQAFDAGIAILSK